MPKQEKKSVRNRRVPQSNRIKNTVFGGAWLLTAAALLGKLLGALYRIPLTRALGTHGMGLYQSVFPMYALLITLTGGGLTAAVSKSVAEQGNDFSVAPVVRLALVLSVPVMLLAGLFCRAIAASAGAPDAALSLAVLLLSVPLSAVCAVLRGSFQGDGNMVPSALGQLVEQTVKLAVGLTLAFSLAPVSLTAAVAGCSAGVTASEGVVLLYYVWQRKKAKRNGVQTEQTPAAVEAVGAVDTMFYGIETLGETAGELVPPELAVPQIGKGTRRKVRRRTDKTTQQKIAWGILKVSLPVTLGLLILPLCQVADSFVVVNLLTRYGAAQDTAMSLYGLVTGPINGLVNLPAVFTVGLCATLLPKVSRLLKRKENVRPTVRKVLWLSLAAGTVFCAGIFLFAPPALRILYGRSLGVPLREVAKLLRTAAVAVLFLVLMQTASAVLQGGGKAYIPALNLLMAAVVKEALQFLLLPRIGIYGFVVATDIFYALACLLDGVALFFFLRNAAHDGQKMPEKSVNTSRKKFGKIR